jgi:hypothetical protein
MLPCPNISVNRGQLTFDAEGEDEENGRIIMLQTRILRVPTDKSGLTIGRVYDMKEKTKKKIEIDLRNAGIAKAKLLSCAARLRGKAAKKFIKVIFLISTKYFLYQSNIFM